MLRIVTQSDDHDAGPWFGIPDDNNSPAGKTGSVSSRQPVEVGIPFLAGSSSENSSGIDEAAQFHEIIRSPHSRSCIQFSGCLWARYQGHHDAAFRPLPQIPFYRPAKLSQCLSFQWLVTLNGVP